MEEEEEEKKKKKNCYAVSQTEFSSSDRRQYSGSQLRDLEVTSLIIIGSLRLWSGGGHHSLGLNSPSCPL